MTDYDNNLRGVLFKNDDKREGKQDPDYTGNCQINDAEGNEVEYWLNGWIKTSKKGTKFMSLSLKPKDERRKPKEAVIAIAETPAFDDEIPF
jgi:hypothetical protein